MPTIGCASKVLPVEPRNLAFRSAHIAPVAPCGVRCSRRRRHTAAPPPIAKGSCTATQRSRIENERAREAERVAHRKVFHGGVDRRRYRQRDAFTKAAEFRGPSTECNLGETELCEQPGESRRGSRRVRPLWWRPGHRAEPAGRSRIRNTRRARDTPRRCASPSRSHRDRSRTTTRWGTGGTRRRRATARCRTRTMASTMSASYKE